MFLSLLLPPIYLFSFFFHFVNISPLPFVFVFVFVVFSLSHLILVLPLSLFCYSFPRFVLFLFSVIRDSPFRLAFLNCSLLSLHARAYWPTLSTTKVSLPFIHSSFHADVNLRLISIVVIVKMYILKSILYANFCFFIQDINTQRIRSLNFLYCLMSLFSFRLYV